MAPSWYLAICFAAIGALAAACSNGASPANQAAGNGSATSAAGQAPATPAPRPPGVPTDATYVEQDSEYGGTELAPAEGPPPQLSRLECTDDVLTVTVPQVVELYASLPCDRAASQSVSDLFIGRTVRIHVVVGDSEKLRLESATAGTLEFTVAGVWAKE